MSGFTYTFKIINPLKIIIMLFIRYVLNYSFIKKNLKHNELTMRNHYQRPIGTAPLSEVNYSLKGKEKVDSQNNHPKNFGKSKKRQKKQAQEEQIQRPKFGERQKPFKCHCCGGPNHIVKKYNIPQHLVVLYQKSLKEARKAIGSFEAHFNVHSMRHQLRERSLMKLKSQA
jgi:hypothetical protein